MAIRATVLIETEADAILARGPDGKKRKRVKRVHDDGGSAMSGGMVVQDDGTDDWGRRDEEEEAAMSASLTHRPR